MYLSLSFIQMLKAGTPVVTMIMGFLFRLEKPTTGWVGVHVCVCSILTYVPACIAAGLSCVAGTQHNPNPALHQQHTCPLRCSSKCILG
jgi:hypothetical protein